jgi:hypothetical protein
MCPPRDPLVDEPEYAVVVVAACTDALEYTGPRVEIQWGSPCTAAGTAARKAALRPGDPGCEA